MLHEDCLEHHLAHSKHAENIGSDDIVDDDDGHDGSGNEWNVLLQYLVI